MDRSFRFLHASDLHLEHPPRGLTEIPDHLRGILADAPYRAAQRVFDAALKHAVDFVVLAGDLCDPALAGPRALVFLSEQLGRLADEQIQVYWAGGPADQFERFVDAWPLPPSVHRFPVDRVERVFHERQGEPVAQILGSSTGGRRRLDAAAFVPVGHEVFSVAVAHGLAEADALAASSVDYWALGGRHTRQTLLRTPATAHYSGTPQGRRPRELGPHGCTLAAVDETRRVRTTLIPTDAVRYCDQRVTVDEATTDEQLFQILDDRTGELLVDPFGPEVIVRFRVAGSRHLASQLRAGTLATDLVTRLRTAHGAKRPGAWTVTVEAPRGANLSAESYDEQTLLGEYLRTVQHYEDQPQERLPLETLLGERHTLDDLPAVGSLNDPAVRRRVLAEAAALGAELLSPPEAER